MPWSLRCGKTQTFVQVRGLKCCFYHRDDRKWALCSNEEGGNGRDGWHYFCVVGTIYCISSLIENIQTYHVIRTETLWIFSWCHNRSLSRNPHFLCSHDGLFTSPWVLHIVVHIHLIMCLPPDITQMCACFHARSITSITLNTPEKQTKKIMKTVPLWTPTHIEYHLRSTTLIAPAVRRSQCTPQKPRTYSSLDTYIPTYNKIHELQQAGAHQRRKPENHLRIFPMWSHPFLMCAVHFRRTVVVVVVVGKLFQCRRSECVCAMICGWVSLRCFSCH